MMSNTLNKTPSHVKAKTFCAHIHIKGQGYMYLNVLICCQELELEFTSILFRCDIQHVHIVSTFIV